MELSELREELENADRALLAALEKRMTITAAIGRLKTEQGLPIEDKARERALIERYTDGKDAAGKAAIAWIYDALFSLSKLRQAGQRGGIGLLGGQLAQSYSKRIHEYLWTDAYRLWELPAADAEAFLKEKNFTALNVTIPYKRLAASLCDRLTPRAEQTGVVNCIKNENGLTVGENTDIDGLSALIAESGIEIGGKKVLILGQGATARTAEFVCRELGGIPVCVSVREPVNEPDAEVIINTTPVGMFPAGGESPVDLRRFPRLCGVIDVICRPARTALYLQAKALGIPAVGGLYMLVAQAAAAVAFFTGIAVPCAVVKAVYRALSAERGSVFLIGMPGCGKSTVGAALSEKLGREYIDLDEYIKKSTGCSPAQMIRERGEAAFREAEAKALSEVCEKEGRVVAVGGGAVLREENRALMRRTGRVYAISCPIGELATEGRPLSEEKGAAAIWEERSALYAEAADKTVLRQATPDDTAEEIRRDFLENIGD